MSKIESNKIYNSSLIINTGGKWTAFEGFPGSEVELFLKDKLEDSVVAFKYHNTGYIAPDTKEVLNNVLVGLNAFGKEVCYERVINADPTYTADFEFQNVTIGSSVYNTGTSYENIQVNKSDNLTATTVFKYLLTGNIAGSEFNETSAQSITFKWFKDLQGTEIDATLDTLTLTVNPGESVLVNISKMFENPFSKRYLGVTFKTPKSDVEITKIFDSPFTLRKLELFYNGEALINTPILTNINLEGTVGEDLGTYKFEYYLDNTNILTYDLSSGTPTDQITLNLGDISEGAHDVFIKAISSGNLASNYIQVSFIYQKTENSSLKDAIAMVSEVPNEISNCNLSKFFKVVTTDHISGHIEIVALKSSNLNNIFRIKTLEDAKSEANQKYLFKEISLDLLSTDTSLKIEYTSYIEIPGNENTNEYLKILIKDGKGVRELGYYQVSSNSVSKPLYKIITITNPKEGSSHLQYSSGEILSFSQISNGNFFTDLSDDLDSSDGLLLENIKEGTDSFTLTTFKVSPTSGVFASPKKLLSAGQTPLHKRAFSIEMLFKTYGVADLEDKIMTIGNITLCPKHIFVNHEPDNNTAPHHTVNASRADFRKEVIQHVVITYDPEYKPSTYDLLYNKFYLVGSTNYNNNAKAFPCLKFYVNGTINRIISISPTTICSENDFKLLIHPTNSNINFYVLRTYDRALNYEEVKKNRISALSKRDAKNAYYDDNNILYTTSDFSAGQLSEKADILNTISLGKCINKFSSISNPNKLYKDRKVLLVALPEGVLPPYYGNRKDDEPKAAFLVHYPQVLTESGYVPSSYSGVLNGGKVKALGSSAKKYMFHNTSYSKFTFTPEAEAKKENPQTYKYYKMPGSDIEIGKLVGKINYASSMQSHKLGACKLFHEAYMSDDLKMNKSWMNGGRKAVLEDEFLYFFVNVPKEDLAGITWDYFKDENGKYNFEKCYFLGFQTWGSAKGDKPTSGYSDATPHYLMLEGADNDNSAANFKTPWASMQIWGNYNNGVWASANSTAIEQPGNYENGKNYYYQFSGKDSSGNPDYITGLLINDETIVFDPGTESENSSDKKADAWDVDFGITEGDGYVEKGKWYLDGEEVDKDTPGAVEAKSDNLFFVFEDEVIESVNRFAQFYNAAYTFDFSSLLYIPPGTEIEGDSWNINGKHSYQYKLLFGASCTIKYGDRTVTPNAGDIYRWEKAWPKEVKENSKAGWVPAGLYHNGTTWENLNIADICNWYRNACRRTGSYPSEYAFFADDKYKSLKAIGDNNEFKYLRDSYEFTGYEEDSVIKNMQACMAEAFKIIMHEYLDINDVSYHQAFIKLVAGTDNRAKNTYFQIVGPIYTDLATVTNGDVNLVKIKGGDRNGTKGYIKDGVFYEVSVSGDSVTETGEMFDAEGLETKSYYYKRTDKGDFKIRLYADDLDTIFKTDNNGQLVKPYYLFEPPYNRNLEHLWGDMHSGFFYNYDLVFIPEIKTLLSKLLQFATGSEWPDTPGTKIHLYFLSIQNNLPSIAYNHMSEIYYESALTLWQDGGATDFYLIFADSGISSWKDFNNNKVQDPVSLSHGSCLEAEVEYLRDRVLLLSTYTNNAKNKTDVGISLNGGSAITPGSEVNIATEYTSFILYIYPIISNIESDKYITSLDYDPLLDYMNWDNTNNRYNNIDLVYNIAAPNEPVDLNVRFTTSVLTLGSSWTSTDLYRTVKINKGTSNFTELFTFPNASTVISQDPDYRIEASEGQELDIVNYLENIEHLVLQEADINSQGLDFTGCNRLKTLVLGKTENNLTDSPEGTAPENIELYAVKFVDVLDTSKQVKLNAAEASTGFRQIILPKSNSVEQVILPNCVEIANINYYPNLTRFEFNDGTLLTNLTIDGRNPNHIIEYILTNFVGTYTTNLEITNVPENFWLTEATCRKLTLIANVKMIGTVHIGDGVNQTAIDWTTKKLLVEKFGNIDSGNLIFKFKVVSFTGSEVTVNATGTIESSGLAPIYLNIPGNSIPIDTATNKNLKIHYTIRDKSTGKTPSTSDIMFQNKYTPYLIIKEGLKGTYIVTSTVFYNTNASKAVETEVTVGFYAPKPGDFAYANGSFSQVCDPTQGIVGVVFYCNKTEDVENHLNVYDVRVLSANYSSTNEPLGPATYAIIDLDYITNITTRQQKEFQQKYSDLLTKLGIETNNYCGDIISERAGGDANGKIVYNSKWSQDSNTELNASTLPNIVEHSYLKNYINLANSFVYKLRGKGVTTINAIENDGWVNPTLQGKENFEKVLNDLKTTSNSIEGFSKSECGPYGFTYALFPAFLSALYYEPISKLTGKGKTYFGLGNWYIPDSRELERLIYYRINSSITNESLTENAWNSIKASTTDVSGKNLNIFNDAFTEIDFLSDSKGLISSVCGDTGLGLAYGTYKDASTSTGLGWHEVWYAYNPSTSSPRDLSHNISPVCRIVLTEKLS